MDRASYLVFWKTLNLTFRLKQHYRYLSPVITNSSHITIYNPCSWKPVSKSSLVLLVLRVWDKAFCTFLEVVFWKVNELIALIWKANFFNCWSTTLILICCLYSIRKFGDWSIRNLPYLQRKLQLIFCAIVIFWVMWNLPLSPILNAIATPFGATKTIQAIRLTCNYELLRLSSVL